MKKLMIVSGLLILVVCLLTGCEGGNTKQQPASETKDFVYVATQGTSKDEADIVTMNNWLRANPNKKIVSFSGVLGYREGVSGYILYFVSGDNSGQKFERINRPCYKHRKEEELAVYGIQYLQTWKDAHPNARIVAIATVAAYSGGVREFTICYEQDA